MNISETLQSVARQLREEERATALTEFVVVLPIFLVAFGAILSLYNAHETALRTHALASAELWKDVRPIQTSYQMQHMHPVAGAIDAGLHYNNTGQWGVMAAKDIGEALGGMYADSGAKVTLANIVENVGVEPKLTLNGILGNNNSHTFNLMNDQILAGQMNMKGFSGIASTLLTQSGARPALAAGIRYGIASSVVRKDFPSSPWLSGQAEAAYTAAAPPMPQGRMMAVALTRLEMGTEAPLQDALMPFTMVPKFASAGSVGSSEEELQQQGEECAQKAREWAECRDRLGPLCMKDKPDCGGDAAEQDGKDLLDCLKNPPGGDSANCG
ncbi:hypothetical protein EA187_00435 [Lujinxingia sediminis]|uniref:Pilus assembly protein n=1 Tax=Lujinxingia sediminis TaxID=2480984 RepID=A0ABY0CVN9_9DELT|nr:hypothetical protein [Lujinxingia sediminis]RVU47937.1 hypothetical protein EA187_00435 [Lujinxingia sediminis]